MLQMRILFKSQDQSMPSCSVCSYHRDFVLSIVSIGFRATQGQGLMPDKTVRYRCQGKDVYHFMGCSSFSEYSVVSWKRSSFFISSNGALRFWKYHYVKSIKMHHWTKCVCSVVVWPLVMVSAEREGMMTIIYCEY